MIAVTEQERFRPKSPVFQALRRKHARILAQIDRTTAARERAIEGHHLQRAEECEARLRALEEEGARALRDVCLQIQRERPRTTREVRRYRRG